MDITTFKICRRIVNGCGSFYGNIAEEAASLNGHRIFLVCDPILAKRAKALNLDAIHDTVHEMARDEARHGKGFAGLLKRYFGK